MNTLLDHIPTEMKRTGTEHAGPCPWCGGDDRFTVSPEGGESGLYWCRRCERGGDGISFLRELHGFSFPEACERLGLGHKVRAEASGGGRPAEAPSAPTKPAAKEKPNPPTDAPGPAWQEAARAFAQECREALHADTDAARSARAWLHGRGFTPETIRAAGLGLNAEERYPARTAWGLPPNKDKKGGDKIWLPRGITIPWETAGLLWKVNIRRLNGDVVPGHDWKGRKYQLITGSANALYGADLLRADLPAAVVEGELDALAIRQTAGDLSGEALVAAVATGSTHGARRVRWIGRLAACLLVLVSFDSDEAGEKAARYWTEALPQARRWRPYWSDPAGMLGDGADLRAWIEAALPGAFAPAAAADTSDVSGCGLEEAAVRWAYPPCAPGTYAWAKRHPVEGETPPAGLEVTPSRRIAARPTPRLPNVRSIEEARQREAAADPLPRLPAKDWQGEARRHAEWLCRAPGTGEEALPGTMTPDPFTLRTGSRVTDPVRFARRLRADVAQGPDGPRARTGALQQDLRLLYQMFAVQEAAPASSSRLINP